MNDDMRLELDSFIFHMYGSKVMEDMYTSVFNHSYDKMYVNEWRKDQATEYYQTVLDNTRKELVAYSKVEGKLDDTELQKLFSGLERRVLVD